VRVGVTRRRRRDVKLAARREPSLAGALADEVGGAAKAQTRLAREALCAWAAEQQLRRSFHHGTRKHDRIADAADENDATGVDLDRVGGRAPRSGGREHPARLVDDGGGIVVWMRTRRRHHSGIHLDVPCGREHGPVAGVEERIVFESHDGSNDSV
jgi:hypothetical protein